MEEGAGGRVPRWGAGMCGLCKHVSSRAVQLVRFFLHGPSWVVWSGGNLLY